MSWTRRALAGVPMAATAGTVGLWWAGQRLEHPRSWGVDGIEEWYDRVGVGAAAVGLVWGVGMAIAIWLTAAVTLQVLSAWVVGLRGLAEAISPAGLRRLAPAVASLSLSAGIGIAPSDLPIDDQAPAEDAVDDERADGAAEAAGGTATMTRTDTATAPTTLPPSTTTSDPPSPSTTLPTTASTTVSTSTTADPAIDAPGADGSAGASAAESNRPEVDPGDEASSATVRPSESPSSRPAAPPATPVLVPELSAGPAAPEAEPRSPRPVVGAEETIRVEPGMSFWSIAEEVLADDGRSPTEREVARYWLTLIEANQDRLIATGNPDLLLPGQELVLPAR